MDLLELCIARADPGNPSRSAGWQHGGPVRLTELFGDTHQLLVQNVMFGPDWDEGCPSCTWAVDNLPANMVRLPDEGVAFAMVSQAAIEKLEAWRTQRGRQHQWVSSGGTTYHYDWGWTQRNEQGEEGPSERIGRTRADRPDDHQMVTRSSGASHSASDSPTEKAA